MTTENKKEVQRQLCSADLRPTTSNPSQYNRLFVVLERISLTLFVAFRQLTLHTPPPPPPPYDTRLR